MSDKVKAQLAPTGVLRAGINLSNFLLVTGRMPNGDPDGVSPDIARARYSFGCFQRTSRTTRSGNDSLPCAPAPMPR